MSRYRNQPVLVVTLALCRAALLCAFSNQALQEGNDDDLASSSTSQHGSCIGHDEDSAALAPICSKTSDGPIGHEFALMQRSSAVLASGLQAKLVRESKTATASDSACSKTVVPSILGMGFGHSGTTTLDRYLSQHPNLSHGSGKEHRFLCGADGKSHQSKSWEMYLTEFEVNCSVSRTFDISPGYHWVADAVNVEACQARFRGSPGIAEMKRQYPADLQLIYTIRDPVDWLNSILRPTAYWSPSYDLLQRHAGKTCYAEYLEPIIKEFGRDSVMVVDFSELVADPHRVMDELCKFLGISPLPASLFAERGFHAGRRRAAGAVTAVMRKRFHHTSQAIDCKNRLEKLINYTFRWAGSPGWS